MNKIIMTAAAALILAAGNANANLGETLDKSRKHYGQPVKIEKRDLADYVTESYVPVDENGNAFGLKVLQTYYRGTAVMVSFYLDRPFTDQWINKLDWLNVDQGTVWIEAGRKGMWFSQDQQFILMCDSYPDGSYLRTYGLVELAGPLIMHDHQGGDTK